MIVVVGKVNHSQSLNSHPLQPWLLVRADGVVELAHCTCMAGLGYAHEYIPTVAKYPTALLGDLYKDDKPASWEAAMAECDHIASTFSVYPEVSGSVEADTNDQAVSTTWFAFQAGRVTA
ncbi:hypothetical protein HPB47_004711 [Ixodes persulcatus]|uniref:Uncharacterized protein n=1 Tax=Ixodes persulcatus TaxID=34615 RepID=A0AC60PGE7_IXOPE|nr:hypothetical protein HPB47_004711 [Ixodes persulcatus]